ncbi:MAG: hypothetical protein AAF749_13125, partial [Pseudomonadota bacterium]
MNTSNTSLLQEILRSGQPLDTTDLPEFIPADGPFDDEQRTFLNGLFAGIYAISKNGGGAEEEVA